jgi:hypothetical protein
MLIASIPGKLVFHELERGQFQIDLIGVVLIHQCRAGERIALDFARRGLQFPEHQLHQRCFPIPVFTLRKKHTHTHTHIPTHHILRRSKSSDTVGKPNVRIQNTKQKYPTKPRQKKTRQRPRQRQDKDRTRTGTRRHRGRDKQRQTETGGRNERASKVRAKTKTKIGSSKSSSKTNTYKQEIAPPHTHTYTTTVVRAKPDIPPP